MEKIIFAGAHPDDFTGCCGTALLMRGKFDTYIWDFTRGERGLTEQGVPMDKCAEMRTKEEEKVAEIAGAKLEFLGETDGEAFAGREVCERIAERLRELNPRAVFTHYIPDDHTDHMMTTAAVLKGIQLAHIRPEVYFYEFSHQTLGFIPEIYVDITKVMDEKIKIIRTYECQNFDDSMVENKKEIGSFRGRQTGVKYAEAFNRCGFIKAGGKCVLDEIFL